MNVYLIFVLNVGGLDILHRHVIFLCLTRSQKRDELTNHGCVQLQEVDFRLTGTRDERKETHRNQISTPLFVALQRFSQILACPEKLPKVNCTHLKALYHTQWNGHHRQTYPTRVSRLIKMSPFLKSLFYLGRELGFFPSPMMFLWGPTYKWLNAQAFAWPNCLLQSYSNPT